MFKVQTFSSEVLLASFLHPRLHCHYLTVLEFPPLGSYFLKGEQSCFQHLHIYFDRDMPSNELTLSTFIVKITFPGGWLSGQESILWHGPVNCNLPTCGWNKHFSMWNVYNAQCFQSNPDLLPSISFKFRALRAFPAPDMFLNRTNANPRIFPSVIRKCLKN